VAKVVAQRGFWRRKYGILQRLGEPNGEVAGAITLTPDDVSQLPYTVQVC
jgi:hypothetical protein